ncbi:NAD(P)-dependent oxidoreductase [Sphingobium chlorophenolicum]|uniref:Putative nucleoside-diphosphate-sugar epimerase n=1 Tax=Sphingobium chlorophenolicum TaxID=46429 RepID=A0A081REF2_SPHCR|nr:NAD(P)H-binding protein [Sphingobium chlorophenolicum]KEQ53575.1 putative nucleoside-diphosphate-sugar epimerase [Sphingobium chlorophenolicum]
MKILVLGGTGPTGRHVIDLCLRNGDSVTALVRDPERIGHLSDRIAIVQGDATSMQNVARAMQGQDAVISTLGRGNSLAADRLFSRAAAAVTGAAGQAHVSRLVWMSSFGVGESFGAASFVQKFLFRTLLRRIYADKAVADAAIRASGLDWTLVYPVALTNGGAKGAYRVADRIEMKGLPSISRADVAAFMHQAVHDSGWIGRDAVIAD